MHFKILIRYKSFKNILFYLDQNSKYVSIKPNEPKKLNTNENLFQLNMKKLSGALNSESFLLNFSQYDTNLYFNVIFYKLYFLFHET